MGANRGQRNDAKRLAGLPAPQLGAEAMAGGGCLVDLPLARLRVRVVGSGPAVVIQPDPPCAVEHYEPLIEALARDRTVICYDAPGFGFSYVKEGFSFSADDYASVVEALLDHLGVRSATLAYTCIGAFVAMLVARRRPDLVANLVLSQVPSLTELKRWAFRLDPVGVLSVPVVGQWFVRTARDPVIRNWFQRALPLGTDTAPWAELALRIQQDGGAYSLASAVQAIGTFTEQSVHGITQPALIVWGDGDRSHARTDKASIRTVIPHAQLVHLPDAGHFPEIEQHVRYRELILGVSAPATGAVARPVARATHRPLP